MSNENQSGTLITHGTHEGLVSWARHQTIDRITQDKEQIRQEVTLVHFHNSCTLQIDGNWDFRIGARYQFQLISGKAVKIFLITQGTPRRC